MKAETILYRSIDVMRERGKARDRGEERSMRKCVEIFNSITGKGLTEAEGWEFMIALKLARASVSRDEDSYIDLAAYTALAERARLKSQKRL